MERLVVLAIDEPKNGAHHLYQFTHVTAAAEAEAVEKGAPGPNALVVGTLQFQNGTFDSPDSIPGTLSNAVIAALIDHFKEFQAGPFPSRETALVITKLEEALFWGRARADDRAERGVLGAMAK
jgi:hypothetical protein